METKERKRREEKGREEKEGEKRNMIWRGDGKIACAKDRAR